MLSCTQKVDQNKKHNNKIENHYNNIVNHSASIDKRIKSLTIMEDIASTDNKPNLKKKVISYLNKASKQLEKRNNYNDIIVILKINTALSKIDKDRKNNSHTFLYSPTDWIEKEKKRRLKEAKQINKLSDWDDKIYGKWRNTVSEFKEQYTFFNDGSFNYIKIQKRSYSLDNKTEIVPLAIIRKGGYTISKKDATLKLIFTDNDEVVNYKFTLGDNRLALGNNAFIKIEG
jgi:DNA-binding protein YbaB